MKRLVFLVEGDTEIILIDRHVIPFLYQKGYQNAMHTQKIVTNRKLNKKGGNVNYKYLRNDVSRVLAQGNVLVTTLLDFFRLPVSFPGYTSDSLKIGQIEQAMWRDMNQHPDYIPYIQRHEIEALMFCNMQGFNRVVDDVASRAKLQELINAYDNPEDINSRPDLAPSKRLKTIFNYEKVVDGEMILEEITVQEMLNKCPRFVGWINRLMQKLR